MVTQLIALLPLIWLVILSHCLAAMCLCQTGLLFISNFMFHVTNREIILVISLTDVQATGSV